MVAERGAGIATVGCEAAEAATEAADEDAAAREDDPGSGWKADEC